MVKRARVSESASGDGRGDGSSSPVKGASASASPVPASTTAATRSGSARIRRASRPRLANRPAPSARPVVSEVMSSSWCASSITTTSCSGRTRPPEPTSMPYRWVLTTMTSAASARRRAASAKHGSPRGQRDGARALLAGHAHRGPRPLAGVPVQLGPVAGGRRGRPRRQPLDLLLGGREQVLQLELAPRRIAHLSDPLEAEVVAPSLQHGPRERCVQVGGQEREVLGGQLVLEGLGGGGDHRGAAGEHGGHQVGQRLAGAGAGLHHQVPAALDGPRHGLGHVGLARAGLAVGEGGGDLRERGHGLLRRAAGGRGGAVAGRAVAAAGRRPPPIGANLTGGCVSVGEARSAKRVGGNVPPWVAPARMARIIARRSPDPRW